MVELIKAIIEMYSALGVWAVVIVVTALVLVSYGTYRLVKSILNIARRRGIKIGKIIEIPADSPANKKKQQITKYEPQAWIDEQSDISIKTSGSLHITLKGTWATPRDISGIDFIDNIIQTAPFDSIVFDVRSANVVSKLIALIADHQKQKSITIVYKQEQAKSLSALMAKSENGEAYFANIIFNETSG
jgi:hypothetical protein